MAAGASPAVRTPNPLGPSAKSKADMRIGTADPKPPIADSPRATPEGRAALIADSMTQAAPAETGADARAENAMTNAADQISPMRRIAAKPKGMAVRISIPRTRRAGNPIAVTPSAATDRMKNAPRDASTKTGASSAVAGRGAKFQIAKREINMRARAAIHRRDGFMVATRGSPLSPIPIAR